MSRQALTDTLLRDIGELYEGADDYNVKIQVGEDSEMEIFNAHSVILRARSTYFRSAFSSNWAKKEGDYFIFKKPNVSAVVFQIMLKYIYTGTIALDAINVESNLIELLIAADEMNLSELVDHLQQHIINLNHDWMVQNGVKLFNIISQRKGIFSKLEKYCNKIMNQEPELLIDSNDFWRLDDETLITFIQLDNLKMEEVNIWENLVKWGIAKNPTLSTDMTTWGLDEYDILKRTLSKFIHHIRFFQMTPQEYYYKVRPLGKLLPKELEGDLLSYYIVPDCKLVTKVLPPRKSQNIKGTESAILTTKHFNLISYWIDDGQETLPNVLKNGQYEFNLLLRGTKDGFGVEVFKKKCNNKGATIVIIKLKNSNKIIGGYNPIRWSESGSYLSSNQSFIFSFYSNTLDSSTNILSRVKDSFYAILDDNNRGQGFGFGDLYIFLKSCKLKHYTTRIHDSDTFEIDDYEVFQVLKK
ncbi:hypothetical protein RclHR1_01980017 [Rhizophagus clarus]|uniref:BTB/POZ protein n=1 Tax=Rhizophagus clarus TaxID=94130 RepID=A0A2Z6QUM5_9GLOM|nr:hypothetical protein RclHR1_01980017 [Rhizophagus clarus]GES92975.1 BTB/POZ protein [Rhizophagus clarus]